MKPLEPSARLSTMIVPLRLADLQNDRSETGRFLENVGLYQPGSTWGFVLVRTSGADAASNATWDIAMEKFHQLLRFGFAFERLHDGGSDIALEDMAMSKFRLVVLDDSVLQAADDDQIRARFADWVQQQGHDLDEISSQARACLVIDDAAMRVIAATPEPSVDRPGLTDSAYVRVLDGAWDYTSEEAREQCKGDNCFYDGWMRTTIAGLPRMWLEFDGQSMCEFCPFAEIEGQIPLYNGSNDGELLNPDTGLPCPRRYC
ncbi:hypothetical protein ANO11243_066860 [Dothideomycetidae sp. 11243]|nr:hypothetical protein ANO11243_066860 [fungal sp. No.11243]